MSSVEINISASNHARGKSDCMAKEIWAICNLNSSCTTSETDSGQRSLMTRPSGVHACVDYGQKESGIGRKCLLETENAKAGGSLVANVATKRSRVANSAMNSFNCMGYLKMHETRELGVMGITPALEQDEFLVVKPDTNDPFLSDPTCLCVTVSSIIPGRTELDVGGILPHGTIAGAGAGIKMDGGVGALIMSLGWGATFWLLGVLRSSLVCETVRFDFLHQG
ncbi:hypothetical protein B0H17DRAFT_1145198 [Mycena rosella]|uniref:Uncharacterized protein n=1 Tax=Mycena rosella TaxID=1033263 RepID=A0AAD7G670_MYCRO|nr:hypothetical protein B0H17DRAFT_1145198 [Mycena rosella]